jgi:hypothetical protein
MKGKYAHNKQLGQGGGIEGTAQILTGWLGWHEQINKPAWVSVIWISG